MNKLFILNGGRQYGKSLQQDSNLLDFIKQCEKEGLVPVEVTNCYTGKNSGVIAYGKPKE